jgi:hypothetical protein
MLLSFVNTQLRDNYPTLEELAAACMVDAQDITDKLAQINYIYDKEKNRFC